MLGAESEFEWGPIEMAEDFQPKYVGIVAAIIGGVVLFLGIVGLLYNLA